MAGFDGVNVDDNFKDLLQVSNNNSGVDSTLRQVSDAEGTNAAFHLSASQAGFEDGAVGAPGWTFGGDANNGAYRIGADTWAHSVGGVNAIEFSTTEVIFNNGQVDRDFRVESNNEANSLLLDAAAGTWFINDVLNANMGVGLTIKQSAGDDEILTLKSPNITHAFTDRSETDTFCSFYPNADNGGITMEAIMEDVAQLPVMQLRAYGGTATTDKDNTGRGLIEMFAAEHNGANAVADVTANGNVYVLRARISSADRTLWINDEDGDWFYDGSDGVQFDKENDAELIRAFSHAVSPRGAIKDQWDKFVSYNEDDLVRLGVLGAPVAKGGLVNGAQLQRLECGAIWQLHTKISQMAHVQKALQAKIARIEAR